jgi:hypothetical protein
MADDDGAAAQAQGAASNEATVPAEAAADTEDQPKDTRSFEERIAALKKPNPIPQPDEGKLNQHISSLNAKIEKCDKRLVCIFYLSFCKYIGLTHYKFAYTRPKLRPHSRRPARLERDRNPNRKPSSTN